MILVTYFLAVQISQSLSALCDLEQTQLASHVGPPTHLSSAALCIKPSRVLKSTLILFAAAAAIGIQPNNGRSPHYVEPPTQARWSGKDETRDHKGTVKEIAAESWQLELAPG